MLNGNKGEKICSKQALKGVEATFTVSNLLFRIKDTCTVGLNNCQVFLIYLIHLKNMQFIMGNFPAIYVQNYAQFFVC